MVFSDPVFIFGFLPLILGVYYVIPYRFITARNFALLCASLFFYAWGEPVWVVLLLISAVLDYTCGRIIGHCPEGWRRKAALATSLIVNLSMLGTFKYADFFLQSLGLLLHRDLPVPGLALPIGISFYTFQTLSYTIDVYRGKVETQRSFISFLLFVSLFPQLVAGPIVRYSVIEHELTKRRANWEQFSQGVSRFIIGLSKKMLLANQIGTIAADAFNADAGTLTSGMAWLGASAWALQLFYDFAGYSDMAIGLGLMFGFHFEENFHYPYIARSITEFWQRWHISLSSWFRDYVYIPLGGNRKGKPRQALNLMIVWGLTGLWHGSAWNCVLWGLYFGVLLLMEKFVWGHTLERFPKVIRHLYTVVLAVIGMAILNANGLEHAISYIGAMFGVGSRYYGGVLWRLLDYKVELLIAIILCLPIAGSAGACLRKYTAGDALRLVGVMALFVLSVIAIVNSSFNPFIYFRF